MILRFGRYKCQDITTVPSAYLIWMCAKAENDQVYGDPWDKKPFKLTGEEVEAAHRELKARGWKCKGLRWEKP
jgi:hypothetical protein